MVMSVLAAAAPAAISWGAGKLLGGKEKKASKQVEKAVAGAKQAANTGFVGGGLSGVYQKNKNRYIVAPTKERQNLVGNISRTFASEAENYLKLREGVRPGVSALRRSRLNELESSRTRSIGNLRDNLARRRVLGSSFATDALGRADQEFAREADKIQAESFLTEMDLTTQFVGKQLEASRQAFQVALNEANLQADTATRLTGIATGELSKAAQLELELAARSASGAGKLAGDQAQGLTTALTSGLQGLFSKGGGGLSDVGLGSWDASVFPA